MLLMRCPPFDAMMLFGELTGVHYTKPAGHFQFAPKICFNTD
jgi:hypothetical protein